MSVNEDSYSFSHYIVSAILFMWNIFILSSYPVANTWRFICATVNYLYISCKTILLENYQRAQQKATQTDQCGHVFILAT